MTLLQKLHFTFTPPQMTFVIPHGLLTRFQIFFRLSKKNIFSQMPHVWILLLLLLLLPSSVMPSQLTVCLRFWICLMRPALRQIPWLRSLLIASRITCQCILTFSIFLFILIQHTQVATCTIICLILAPTYFNTLAPSHLFRCSGGIVCRYCFPASHILCARKGTCRSHQSYWYFTGYYWKPPQPHPYSTHIHVILQTIRRANCSTFPAVLFRNPG